MTRPMNASCDPYGRYGNSTWMPPMWYTFLGVFGLGFGPGVAETISGCSEEDGLSAGLFI
jgi:hypothetical protein